MVAAAGKGSVKSPAPHRAFGKLVFQVLSLESVTVCLMVLRALAWQQSVQVGQALGLGSPTKENGTVQVAES